MHKTAAGEQLKALKKQAQTLSRDAQSVQKAQTPVAHKEAKRLQEKADQTLAEAKDLKQRARLEDLQVWEMEKVKESKKGSKKYTYWMASWREGDKVRNVHLGSCRKLSKEDAVQQARKLKAESLANLPTDISF
jgi:hypothetical protein